jgi:hypothetical protein
MRRAIVVFIENKRNLMLQFGCLYTSFKFIKPDDTDLVVFGTRKALGRIADDCIKVEYKPISYFPEWKNYHYINSISCLTDDSSNFLEQYDLLLRTDVDTFLTPAWNSFYPDFYTTGRGGYVNDDETRNNIKRIAKIFGLNHKGLHNIGSTQYGNSGLVRDVCKLAVRIAKYILNKEFIDCKGEWPGWSPGVSSMYSTEIAVNHLVETVLIDGSKLDYDSTGGDPVIEHPHIHCWHTDNLFSKFWFEAGKYDHLSQTDLNIDKVRDYCLYIALRSKEEMPWLG